VARLKYGLPETLWRCGSQAPPFFGARQPLRQRGLAAEQPFGDGRQLQPGQRAQSHRHLGCLRHGRVAGGQDPRQFVAVQFAGKAARRRRRGQHQRGFGSVCLQRGRGFIVRGPGRVAAAVAVLVDHVVVGHASIRDDLQM